MKIICKYCILFESMLTLIKPYGKEDKNMRLFLILQLKNAELPTDYRRLFLSFFKKALESSKDGIYMEKFYKDTIQKNFTWAAVLDRPTFGKEKIELGSKEIRLIFSTDNENNTGYIFFLALSVLKYQEFPIPKGNSMTLRDIRQVKEEKITGTTCVFKTIPGSPIVVRMHTQENNEDQYITVEDSNYNEELTNSIKRQLKDNTQFAKEIIEQMRIECIQGKKVVVKNYKQYIDTTAGTFVIHAAIPVIKYLMEVGVSGRRSMGFGTLQLISQLEED